VSVLVVTGTRTGTGKTTVATTAVAALAAARGAFVAVDGHVADCESSTGPYAVVSYHS